MSRFRKLTLLLGLLVGAALLGVAPDAQGAFTLTITEAGSPPVTTTVVDNGAGDADSRVGLITFSGSVGDFNIQVSIGTSNAAQAVTPAQLTINNLSIDSAGFAVNTTKTLSITLQDTGFTVPGAGPVLMTSQLSTTQMPANTNVTFQSSINGTAGTLLSLNTVGGTSRVDNEIIPTNPYTLANVTTYTIHGQGAGNSLTVQSTGLTSVVVPAPAGFMLALSGLPFAGFGCWLRRRQKA